MTAATLSRLPISAGGALTGSLARGGVWLTNRLVDFGLWGIGQFLRAPVAISLVVAATGFSVLAGSNALFLQANRHPAPLFFSAPKAAALPAVETVIPRFRSHVPPALDNLTTGSVGGAPSAGHIGNAEVLMLQRKLAALHFYDGSEDGLFGRRTAGAVKAFEVRNGMKPRGKLTPEVLAAVNAAPLAVASTATAAASLALVAKPAALAVVPLAPVPLAPMRTSVATAVQPASLAVQASPVVQPIPLAAQPPTANATMPTDTFAAHAADPSPAVPAPQPVPLAAAAPAPTAAPQQVAAIDPVSSSPVATAGAVMSMNSPAAPAPVAAAASIPAPTAANAATANAAATPAPATPGVGGTAVTDPNATPAQKLAAQMGTLPPEATAATVAATSSDPGDDSGSTDPVLITKIQRALASLGFLGAKIDGQPGEATAKAIRNFEVFYDYRLTGLATPQLLDLLVQHGATI